MEKSQNIPNLRRRKNKLDFQKELFSTPEFWVESLKSNLLEVIQDYKKKHDLNNTQLAKKLGVTKGYISQLLNSDKDHRISTLFSLALKLDKAPYIYFKDINAVWDKLECNKPIQIDFKDLEYKAEKYSNLLSNEDIKHCDNNIYNVPTFDFSKSINYWEDLLALDFTQPKSKVGETKNSLKFYPLLVEDILSPQAENEDSSDQDESIINVKLGNAA